VYDTASVKHALKGLSVAMLASTMLVACASAPDDEIHSAKKTYYCVGGDIPSCIEKVGKPIRCFCANEDDLRELLDPNNQF
jgi:hypothetical protein